MKDFWSPGGGVVALTRRQHEIYSQLALREYLTWSLTASVKDKQRMVSASAKNASLWITAFPVAPEMVIADEFFILAVKHRLGLRPMEDLPQKCSCDAKLGEDPQHFFSCRHLRRKAMTQRHDSIVRILRDLFHKVGAVVHVEPRLYDTKRVRPDLDILLPDQNLMLDVAVTHPGAPSRKSVKPLAAATAIQSNKTRDYKAWAEERGGKFFGFVMETHGALGKQACEVLKYLAKAAATATLAMPPGEFLRLSKQSLSVALQRGNGLVAKMGAIQARGTNATAERASRAR